MAPYSYIGESLVYWHLSCVFKKLFREKFPNTRKPSHCRIRAELWKHRGQHNREKKINKQLKLADCEPYGNSSSGEAAQTPASAISKRGLGREARRGLHR